MTLIIVPMKRRSSTPAGPRRRAAYHPSAVARYTLKSTVNRLKVVMSSQVWYKSRVIEYFFATSIVRFKQFFHEKQKKNRKSYDLGLKMGLLGETLSKTRFVKRGIMTCIQVFFFSLVEYAFSRLQWTVLWYSVPAVTTIHPHVMFVCGLPDTACNI